MTVLLQRLLGAPSVAQSTDIETFLGDDLLAWLALAIGAALALGTLLALVRPPAEAGDGSGGERQRPPLARSAVMIAIGTVAAAWGLATLLAG